MRSPYFIIGLALVGALPAWAQTTNTPTSVGQVIQDPITEPIQKYDTLRVLVIGEPLYTGTSEFKVSADGTIELPRIGQVRVAGNSNLKAASFIEQRLKSGKFLKEPHALVTIIDRKRKEVSLNGAVGIQGRRVLREGTRLSDVLEEAGLAQLADLEKVEVTRGKEVLAINYKKFRNGLDNSETVNPFLEDGDRIFIRLGEPTEGTVKVVGEVKDLTKPQLSISQGSTFSQVLSMVGGITDYGDRKGVFLIRGTQRIPVPYDEIVGGATDKDIKLLDKDEIHIPRLEKPSQYTVMGGVRTAGPVPLQGKVTLIQAFANAGPLEGAKRKDIQLFRKGTDGLYPKKPKKLSIEDGIEASTVLQDGDVVIIPDPSRGNKFDFNQVLSTLGSMIWISSLLRR
ncbi:polysaccharide biosynthesis/export family protein [Armatimonas sp.]|uniref:polysaccharide biosynthesis/export family protein n=1 Tax=Armatimonas sp. TaxID=1872638 RepID=UPI003750F832